MKTYTLDNIRFDETNNIYDIFQKTVVDNKDKPTLTTTVEEGEDMRLDKVCKRLYGNTYNIEELKALNNILNEYTIKAGDDIIYVDPYYISLMRETDNDTDNSKAKSALINNNKNTKKDPNRADNLPPSVMPANKKSVDINKNNQTIKIMNSFE